MAGAFVFEVWVSSQSRTNRVSQEGVLAAVRRRSAGQTREEREPSLRALYGRSPSPQPSPIEGEGEVRGSPARRLGPPGRDPQIAGLQIRMDRARVAPLRHFSEIRARAARSGPRPTSQMPIQNIASAPAWTAGISSQR